ncbi:hypothetical protein ACFO3N_25060, partial [Flavobacterium chungangensis]
VSFNTSANYMPNYPVPAGEDETSWFVKEVEAGLHHRYPGGIPDEVRKQAAYETEVITQMGFPGYFLVVAETGAYRLTRLWLTGHRAGESDVFADGLPGFPDNLSTGPGGLIWVAMAAPRQPALDLERLARHAIKRARLDHGWVGSSQIVTELGSEPCRITLRPVFLADHPI